MKKLLVFTVFSTMMFLGCKDENIIEEDKFIKIYSNLIIAQDTSGAILNSVDSIRTVVLNHYKIKDSQYKATLDYYNNDPERWVIFFDKVIYHLEQEKKNIQDSL